MRSGLNSWLNRRAQNLGMSVDQPRTAFGLRGTAAQRGGPVAAQQGRAGGAAILRIGLAGVAIVLMGLAVWSGLRLQTSYADAARATARVIEIVNQPVRHLARSGPVAVYSPGWFHAGAIRPDFNTVDVRTTQELIYKDHVTSDLNPTEMFIGSELEFNAMTKYFYADLSLPKKRLSGLEMEEINSLYRTIGASDDAILTRALMLLGSLILALGAAAAALLIGRGQEI